jgi:hypothetical protein
MKIILVIAVILVVIATFLFIMNHLFYSRFLKLAKQIRTEAGKQSNTLITEADLRDLPLPVARYIRFTGLVGKKRISTVRILHSGTFKPGADKSFLPVRGEYYLTTEPPSFCWYGKVSLLPGLNFAACDSYFKGIGRMLVKVMSTFKIVDAGSKETGFSAFGRCMAEMTLVPSFFLDNQRLKWISSDSSRAECTVTDSGLSTRAQLYFNPDGSLEKIEVERYFDRGNGQVSPEKFTGSGKDFKEYSGLKLASVIDGYWNLSEGDLHYVHFIIDRVETD